MLRRQSRELSVRSDGTLAALHRVDYRGQGQGHLYIRVFTCIIESQVCFNVATPHMEPIQRACDTVCTQQTTFFLGLNQHFYLYRQTSDVKPLGNFLIVVSQGRS